MASDEINAVTKIEGEVRKANEAIAIRPKSGDALTFLTRKLYNTMLFHAQKQGVDQRRFSMPLRLVTRGSDFDSNDTQLVKKHLRKMRGTEIEWNDPGKEWGIASLVSEVVIKKVGGELIIEWEYPTAIHTRLLTPLQYTPIALAHQAIMRTHAGLALLEICLRYETFHQGITERQPWEWWYPVLTGNTNTEKVAKRAYFYRYFKRDTINPAIVEVNSLTDFHVELVEHTRGRKIVDLQFKIAKRSQQQLDLESHLFDMSLVSRMTALGLKEGDAQKLYSSHEENRLRAALDVTEKKMRSRVKPESPIAYFRSALTGEWLQSDGEPKTKKALPPVKSAPIPDAEQSTRQDAALATFDSLPDADKDQRWQDFLSANPGADKAYGGAKRAGVLARRALGVWLAKQQAA